MDTTLLFGTLTSIRPLRGEIMEGLISRFGEVRPDKVYLLKEGRVADRLWFLNDGYVRAFHTEGMKEDTLWFAGPGEFFTARESFCRQRPSKISIVLQEDAYLLSLSYDHLQELRRLYPEIERIYDTLLQEYLLRDQQRDWSRIYDPPELRLRKLLQEYPRIFGHATRMQIASYLGISLTTLKRVRKRI